MAGDNASSTGVAPRTKSQAKKNRPAGRFNEAKLITSMPERQQPKRRQQQPKQPKQQPKRPKQRLQQRPARQRWCRWLPEQRRLRQQPERPERQPEQQWFRQQEQRPELLLSCCKQPEQQPAGKRSAGIFSWFFLN
jgi:hypothetical protein